MSKPVSYTPPHAGLGASECPDAVRRRHVFYIPGYDPEARSRYRLLFVRELTRYAKRFGGGKRDIGRAGVSEDGLVQSWQVAAHAPSRGAETSYDVLLWDDVVARDFARSRFVSLALLFLGTSQVLIGGQLVRFYRLNWKYGNIIIYPFVMMLLLGVAMAGIATLVHAGLGDGSAHGLRLPAWVSIPAGILAALGFITAIEVQLNRIFFWQLVNDWVFNWQHSQGRRRDYESRVDTFAERVRARIAAFDASAAGRPDEIMIVGHSTGALTAVEVAARVLAQAPRLGEGRPDEPGPVLSLVTLGSGLPLVALQPRAKGLRREIASLVASRRIVWVDYVAPQDWLNFPGFNPIVDLDLRLGPEPILVNPTIRSARFRDIIDDETYRKVRFRPFRMHFQFLMANDRPGEYDFFDMTLGPRRLRERVRPAEDEPSARPVHPFEPFAA